MINRKLNGRLTSSIGLVSAVALILGGCGGGGGGTKDTSKNTVLPPVNSTVDGINTSQTDAEIKTAASLQLEAVALAIGSTSGDPTSTEGLIEAQQVAQFASGSIGPFVVTTTTIFCGADPAADTGNGSIVTVRDDVDPPGTSTGDTVKVTFNDCNQFGRVISGSRTYTVVNATGTPGPGAVFALETTRSGDITTVSTRGTRVSVNTAAAKISSTGTVVTAANTGDGTDTVTPVGGTPDVRTRTFSTDSTQDSSNQTFTRSFKSTSKSTTQGDQTVETITPLSGVIGAPPTAGVIKISIVNPAANVNQITTITALPGGLVRIEVDNNGDGVIDSTVEVPWTGLIGIGIGVGGGGSFTGSPGNPGIPVPPVGGTTPPPVGGAPPTAPIGGGSFGGGTFAGGGARTGGGFVGGTP